MRLFIALDIDDSIREHIATFHGRRRPVRTGRALEATPESLHVTLKFIGEQPESASIRSNTHYTRIQSDARRFTFAATDSSPPRNPRAYSGSAWIPPPTSHSGSRHRQYNGISRNSKRSPRLQPSPDAGAQRRQFGRPVGARNTAEPDVSTAARETLTPDARVWYHDAPRVLSVSDPALPERIEVHQTGSVCVKVAPAACPEQSNPRTINRCQSCSSWPQSVICWVPSPLAISLSASFAEDVRQSGSGNIGATNVSRKSPVLGQLTLLLDALKGTCAVFLANEIFARMRLESRRSWFAGVLTGRALRDSRHMFPVWLRFAEARAWRLPSERSRFCSSRNPRCVCYLHGRGPDIEIRFAGINRCRCRLPWHLVLMDQVQRELFSFVPILLTVC